MSEDAEEITVTVKALNEKSMTAKLKLNETVNDLVKKIINNKSLCDVEDLKKSGVKGFQLRYSGKCITNINTMNDKIQTLDGGQEMKVMIVYIRDNPNIDLRSAYRDAVWFDDILGTKDKKKLNLKVEEDEQIIEGTDKEVESKKSSWPAPRIIVGITDLFLLAAAITTFLLNVHIAVTIVLVALLVVFAVVLFGWDKKVLSKILPKGCLIVMGFDANLYKGKNKQSEKEKPEQSQEKEEEQEEEQEIE